MSQMYCEYSKLRYFSPEHQYPYLKVTMICYEITEIGTPFVKGVALNCVMVSHTFVVIFTFIFSC